jgi:hypothetical protein
MSPPLLVVPKLNRVLVYHIHVNPVDSNGNCSSTAGHLDPYSVGEVMACDPKKPEACQVGDLSGKHGVMDNGTSFQAKYFTPIRQKRECVDRHFTAIPTCTSPRS